MSMKHFEIYIQSGKKPVFPKPGGKAPEGKPWLLGLMRPRLATVFPFSMFLYVSNFLMSVIL